MRKFKLVRTKRENSRRGFTLIELLLALGLFSILLAAAYPAYQSVTSRTDLDQAAEITVRALRRAEMLARGGAHDGPWGVDVAPGRVTIFQGTSFAARDRTVDEVVELPRSVDVQGLLDVVFDGFTGAPRTLGAITFSSLIDRSSRQISWNAKGIVNY